MNTPDDNAKDHVEQSERSPSATKGPDGVSAALEELADDMLGVIQRLAQIDQRQVELGDEVRAMASVTTRTIDVLRRDLLGERKALAIRQVADVVAPALDSFIAMHRGIDGNTDARMQAQLTGVIAILENVLIGMGFVSFSPAVGEPFDPERMESAGDAEGPPGTVLEVVRCGYIGGQLLIRPAAVLIGRQLTTPSPKDMD